MTILLSEKIYFKAKIAIRDKEHFIRIKLSIHQEDITIIVHMHLIIEPGKKNEAKPYRIEGRNRQFSNNSCTLT